MGLQQIRAAHTRLSVCIMCIGLHHIPGSPSLSSTRVELGRTHLSTRRLESAYQAQGRGTKSTHIDLRRQVPVSLATDVDIPINPSHTPTHNPTHGGTDLSLPQANSHIDDPLTQCSSHYHMHQSLIGSRDKSWPLDTDLQTTRVGFKVRE